jgi:hypothetical protein
MTYEDENERRLQTGQELIPDPTNPTCDAEEVAQRIETVMGFLKGLVSQECAQAMSSPFECVCLY